MRIITAIQAAELDKKAMTDYGILGIDLMGSAGKSIANEAKKMIVEIHDPRIVIVCGKGNNGGDGFAAAVCLDGFDLHIFSLVKAKKIKGDAVHFHDLCLQNNINITYDDEPPETLECDLIIDGILGIGCQGELQDEIAKWTRWINTSVCPVLAIDCPTGIDSNRGTAAKHSLHVKTTVTMGYPKLGLCIKQGKEHSGEIISVDIGFPKIVDQLTGIRWETFAAKQISKMLSNIKADTYKHRQGKVLIIAGSKGMTGAAVLSSFGALRAGAGLTITCAPNSIEDIYEKTIVEGMTIGCPDNDNGFLIEDSYASIADKYDWCDVIVIGPGLGKDNQTLKLVERVVLKANKPLIIDADALRIFQGNLDLFNKITVPFIITPHEGEFCMLLGINREKFLNNYPDNIEVFMSSYPDVMILKNAPTITFQKNVGIVNPSGNPGMATAGMGDVLAGILGAFVAQGMEVFQAAQTAVYLHGIAADRKIEDKGFRGLIASDILDELPRVMREVD